MDLISGPYWYAGPDFTTKHEIYPGTEFNPNGYSDNFASLVYDFNNDRWKDVLVIGYPGEAAHWFQNPKSPDAAWPSHVALSIVDTESPTFGDLTGDGKPELICAQNGQLGWAEPNVDTSLMWKFHPVTPKRDYEKYTHGLGFGDVNMDILERNAW